MPELERIQAHALVRNLLETQSIDWTMHATTSLLSPSFTLSVCAYHFPEGSDARAEVERAVALFNQDTTGVSIAIEEVPHLSVSDMYYGEKACTSPVFHFDFVDETFPCHKLNDPESGTWADPFAMNTCRYTEDEKWGGNGRTCFFNVGINSYNYDFASDSSKTDFPKAANIAHELGHGFGMNHTDTWPPKDQDFVSIMQGNHEMLSAYDLAFLDHFYPAPIPDEAMLGISRQTRIRNQDGSFLRYTFDSAFDPSKQLRENPKVLYFGEDGYALDCATKAFPLFYLTWFNISKLATDGEPQDERLRAGLVLKSVDGFELPLAEFSIAEMPLLSQDRRTVEVRIPNKEFVGFSLDAQHMIKFLLDSSDRNGVVGDELEGTLSLVASNEECPD